MEGKTKETGNWIEPKLKTEKSRCKSYWIKQYKISTLISIQKKPDTVRLLRGVSKFEYQNWISDKCFVRWTKKKCKCTCKKGITITCLKGELKIQEFI